MVRVRLHGREFALHQHQAAETETEEVVLTLPVGAEAELRSDDPGFQGSFYEVTVTAHLPSQGRYKVLYSTLVAQDGTPLQETAPAANLRPRPSPLSAAAGSEREFALHEAVEAFHNEGWWAGVVSAVPPPQKVYEVVFPTSREKMEFEEKDLRPDRVFHAGRWVPVTELADGSPPLFPEGTQVEVSQSPKSFGEFWSPASVLKVIGATNFLVKYTHIGQDGEVAAEIIDSQYIRPARTNTPTDSKFRASPSSHVEVMHEDSWWPGVIQDVVRIGMVLKYAVEIKRFKTGMNDVEGLDRLVVENTKLRPRFDWDGKRWARRLKDFVNVTKLTSRKRPGSSASSLSKEVGESSDKNCSYRGKKLKSADLVSEPTSPEETMKQGNAAVALGSQLAPPSLPSMEGFAHLSDCSLAQSSQNIITSSAPLPQSRQLQASILGTSGQPRALLQGPILGMQSLNPHTPKKGTAAKSIEEARTFVSMSEDLAKPNNGVDLRYNVTAGRSEIDMVNCVDPTKTPNDVGGSQQGGGSAMDDRVTESLAIQHLPFVKTSPLWAQIEGMEIFSRAPQRPQLNHLLQHNPLLREGVALGLMLSFANVAESINRLDDADDDNNEGGLLEEKMQGLSFLEANGFEVRALSSRLETLLHRKNSRGAEACDDAMKALEEKISRKETDDRELGMQIRVLAMAVRDLGIYGCLMREIMWSAVAQKLNSAVEMTRLKAEANELERSAAAAAL